MRRTILLQLVAKPVAGIAVAMVLCVSSSAATRHVPAEYPTIQAAINACRSGDTVIVAAGTYNERIDYSGKNIVVTSTDPGDPEIVADTIIDGNGEGSVVTFENSETAEAVLTGFTISGDTKGQVWYFKNTGTDAAPVLAEGVRMKSDGVPILGKSTKLMGIYSKLDIADYNSDGLADILVGHSSPAGHDFVVYQNTGTKTEPKFGKPKPFELPEPKMSRPSPCLVDWDKDGINDLLCGTESADVYFFKNMGSNKEPAYDPGKKIELAGFQFDIGYRGRFDVTDWNNDGKLDLLVGNAYRINNNPTYGNVWLFLAK